MKLLKFWEKVVVFRIQFNKYANAMLDIHKS